ncbi:unnamed protein product [Amoebophrya sp. A25]|nr:unnamed protein product [Amoebophrya sp. A25]|eukprot:GSA25T00027720001.1
MTTSSPSEAKYASLLPSGTSQKMSTDGPLGTSSGSKFGARFGFETEVKTMEDCLEVVEVVLDD